MRMRLRKGWNATGYEMILTPRNIVATVNLECRLDLKTIALHARNAEYNPKVCLRPRFFYVDVLSLCY
jgi:hypothetical protein